MGLLKDIKSRRFSFIGMGGNEDNALLDLPLLTNDSFLRGTTPFTFPTVSDSDLDRYVRDHEGIWRGVLAEETRFNGARRVENLVSSEDWSTFSSVSNMTVTSGVTDPNGGITAYTLTATDNNGAAAGKSTLVSGDVVVNSFWIRRRTGTGGIQVYTGADGWATTVMTSTITSSWQRITPGKRTSAGAGNNGYGLNMSSSGDAVDVWYPQQELTTGGIDEDTPSEYVSVGVESDPWHGSNVDAVKYFDYANPNTVISNVVTDDKNKGYGGFLGANGDYITTPDSAAASITGDIDIRVKVSLDDWIPSTESNLVGKFQSTSTRSYYFNVSTGGALRFYNSTDGLSGTEINVASTSVSGFTDGEIGWVRVTLDVDDGSSNHIVKFYTSTDGVTWTQNGDTNTVSGTTSIFDSNSEVSIGGVIAGTNSMLTGKIYEAQIYNGIDGTLAVSYDAADYDFNSLDTTFTSSDTGEVYTVNGTVTMHEVGATLGQNLIGAETGLSRSTIIGTGGNFTDNLGADIVTNGDFASDTGWTKGTGWTISGGTASSDGTQVGNSNLSLQGGGLVPLAAYLFVFTVSNYSSGTIKGLLGNAGATARSADGTYVEVVTAGAGTTLVMQANVDFVGDIDNVAVYPLAAVGLDGWTAIDAEALIVGNGSIHLLNRDASLSEARTTITTVVNTLYTWWVGGSATLLVGLAANGQLRIGTSAGNNSLVSQGFSVGSSDIKTGTFTATGTTTHIALRVNTATIGAETSFSGIYITEGIPITGYFAEGAETNEITQPRDLTNAAWSTTGTSVSALDAVGIDGQPNSATTSTDNDGSNHEFELESVTITGNTSDVLFSVYVKKNSTTNQFPVMKCELSTTGTTTVEYLHLNTSTGATAESDATDAGFATSGSIDMGDWWLLYGTILNQSNTVAIMSLYPSAATTIGTLSTAAQSSNIFDGAAVSQDTSYPTSPILKTGVTTRNSDAGATLDLANWSDATGSIEFDVTTEYLDAGTGDKGLVTPAISVARGVKFIDDKIRFSDGTTTLSITPPFITGQSMHVKARWNSGTSKKNFSVDGTSATEGAFDGSFNVGTVLRLLPDIAVGASISNLKTYKTDKGESWLSE